MKIQTSVRQIFDEQNDVNIILRRHVDATMQALRQPRWHYESRLKELQSFALKLETCRVPEPAALEDFLACTLVVPNVAAINEAVAAVRRRFVVKYQRPKKPLETQKSADSFPFDDLRLYCCRGNDGTLPPEPTDGVLFEVQVKTFLQHAWAVATHDLTYKTDDVSWGKDRVVAHLKASIEHVELSVQEALHLAQSPAVALKNPRVAFVAELVTVLQKYWRRDALPANLRGLAQSVSPLLTAMDLSAGDLDQALKRFKTKSGGSLPLNLSPYGVILTVMLLEHQKDLDEALAKSTKPMIFITPELQLPDGFPSLAAASKVIYL